MTYAPKTRHVHRQVVANIQKHFPYLTFSGSPGLMHVTQLNLEVERSTPQGSRLRLDLDALMQNGPIDLLPKRDPYKNCIMILLVLALEHMRPVPRSTNLFPLSGALRGQRRPVRSANLGVPAAFCLVVSWPDQPRAYHIGSLV